MEQYEVERNVSSLPLLKDNDSSKLKKSIEKSNKRTVHRKPIHSTIKCKRIIWLVCYMIFLTRYHTTHKIFVITLFYGLKIPLLPPSVLCETWCYCDKYIYFDNKYKCKKYDFYSLLYYRSFNSTAIFLLVLYAVQQFLILSSYCF